MHRTWKWIALTGIGLALAVGCQRQVASVTPTPTAVPTETATPSATWTATITWTAPPPTETATPSLTPSLSQTLWPTATPSPTLIWTATATPSATVTLSATATPSATQTLTPTVTPTPTQTPTPLPTPDGLYREAMVPILMYHYISEPPEDANALRRDLSVSPEDFAQQLAYFFDQGYQSITLHDLVRHLQRGDPLPAKPILFSFDDGHKDHYLNAFPLLREYGFTGTFFVITGFADAQQPDYLSWDDIRAMQAAGMEFGSHSYSHPDLRGQTVDYIVWQSLGPKQALEERVASPVISYCYPFGFYDDQVIAVVHSANYWCGITTQQGVLHATDRLFELARVRVRGTDAVEDLVARIEYLAQVAETATPTPTHSATPQPTAAATPTKIEKGERPR